MEKGSPASSPRGSESDLPRDPRSSQSGNGSPISPRKIATKLVRRVSGVLPKIFRSGSTSTDSSPRSDDESSNPARDKIERAPADTLIDASSAALPSNFILTIPPEAFVPQSSSQSTNSSSEGLASVEPSEEVPLSPRPTVFIDERLPSQRLCLDDIAPSLLVVSEAGFFKQPERKACAWYGDADFMQHLDHEIRAEQAAYLRTIYPSLARLFELLINPAFQHVDNAYLYYEDFKNFFAELVNKVANIKPDQGEQRHGLMSDSIEMSPELGQHFLEQKYSIIANQILLPFRFWALKFKTSTRQSGLTALWRELDGLNYIPMYEAELSALRAIMVEALIKQQLLFDKKAALQNDQPVNGFVRLSALLLEQFGEDSSLIAAQIMEGLLQEDLIQRGDKDLYISNQTELGHLLQTALSGLTRENVVIELLIVLKQSLPARLSMDGDSCGDELSQAC